MGTGESKIKAQEVEPRSKYQNGSTGVGWGKGVERIVWGAMCDTHIAGAGWSAGGAGVRGVWGVGNRNAEKYEMEGG